MEGSSDGRDDRCNETDGIAATYCAGGQALYAHMNEHVQTTSGGHRSCTEDGSTKMTQAASSAPDCWVANAAATAESTQPPEKGSFRNLI